MSLTKIVKKKKDVTNRASVKSRQREVLAAVEAAVQDIAHHHSKSISEVLTGGAVVLTRTVSDWFILTVSAFVNHIQASECAA